MFRVQDPTKWHACACAPSCECVLAHARTIGDKCKSWVNHGIDSPHLLLAKEKPYCTELMYPS